jgi:hypothetical protein
MRSAHMAAAEAGLAPESAAPESAAARVRVRARWVSVLELEPELLEPELPDARTVRACDVCTPENQHSTDADS